MAGKGDVAPESGPPESYRLLCFHTAHLEGVERIFERSRIPLTIKTLCIWKQSTRCLHALCCVLLITGISPCLSKDEHYSSFLHTSELIKLEILGSIDAEGPFHLSNPSNKPQIAIGTYRIPAGELTVP